MSPAFAISIALRVKAFGLPLEQRLDRERGLVTRAFRPAGISRPKPATIA